MAEKEWKLNKRDYLSISIIGILLAVIIILPMFSNSQETQLTDEEIEQQQIEAEKLYNATHGYVVRVEKNQSPRGEGFYDYAYTVYLLDGNAVTKKLLESRLQFIEVGDFVKDVSMSYSDPTGFKIIKPNEVN